MDSNLTDLLNRFQSNSQHGFELVYRLVIANVKRIAHRRKRRSGISVETTQLADEAMLKIGRSPQVGRFASREKFLAYSERVIANLLLDQVRKSKAARRIPANEQRSLEHNAPVVGGSEFNALVADLSEELEAVHEHLGFVFRGYLLDERSFAEMAAQLNKPPAEIEALWKTAVAIAKRKLAVNS